MHYLVKLKYLLRQVRYCIDSELERTVATALIRCGIARLHDFKSSNNLLAMVLDYANLQTLRMCTNHPRSPIKGNQEATLDSDKVKNPRSTFHRWAQQEQKCTQNWLYKLIIYSIIAET